MKVHISSHDWLFMYTMDIKWEYTNQNGDFLCDLCGGFLSEGAPLSKSQQRLIS